MSQKPNISTGRKRLYPTIKNLNIERFIDALETKGKIEPCDRDVVYLRSEEVGIIYGDGELDDLIRRAVTIWNPSATAKELKQIIDNSKE